MMFAVLAFCHNNKILIRKLNKFNDCSFDSTYFILFLFSAAAAQSMMMHPFIDPSLMGAAPFYYPPYDPMVSTVTVIDYHKLNYDYGRVLYAIEIGKSSVKSDCLQQMLHHHPPPPHPHPPSQ